MYIRPVAAEDWEAFRDLRLRALADAPDAFRRTLDTERDKPDQEWADMVRTVSEHQDAESWVAEMNGVAVGQAFSKVRDDRSTLGIGGMWVAPEARGRGVGRALLDTAESWGRDHGCTAASLSVTGGNSAAEQLYRKAGYALTGAGEQLREGSALECVELAKQL